MGNLSSKSRILQKKNPSPSTSTSTLSHAHTAPPPVPPQQQNVEPVFLSASLISSLPSEGFPTISRGKVTWQTLLSSPSTPSNALTAGIARCPPQTGSLALHRHAQAEIYFILGGEGVMTVESREEKVEKGGMVFVPGNAKHGIRNEGREELVWVYVFAVDGFGEVVYRFAGEEGDGE